MQEQSGPGPQIAGEVLPVNDAATAPAAPAVRRGGWRRFLIELLIGFSVLVLGSLAGEQVKQWLHLPVPGNVLGLFFLLLSFRLRLLPPQLIEKAANQVLYVLPSLFIPIYVSAIGQGQLWSRMSWILVPMLLLVTAGLCRPRRHEAFLSRRDFMSVAWQFTAWNDAKKKGRLVETV